MSGGERFPKLEAHLALGWQLTVTYVTTDGPVPYYAAFLSNRVDNPCVRQFKLLSLLKALEKMAERGKL